MCSPAFPSLFFAEAAASAGSQPPALATWGPAIIGFLAALALAFVTRLFARTDKTELAQIEMMRGAVNANVEVIKSLQEQVRQLTERNALLDLRRAEAETEKTRAMVTLQEAEIKYRALLVSLEGREAAAAGTSAVTPTPREGGRGAQ